MPSPSDIVVKVDQFPLDKALCGSAMPPLESGGGGKTTEPLTDMGETSTWSGRRARTAALVTGGAGIVAVEAGTALGLLVASNHKESSDIGPKNDCTDQHAASLNPGAKLACTIANVSFAVGSWGS